MRLRLWTGLEAPLGPLAYSAIAWPLLLLPHLVAWLLQASAVHSRPIEFWLSPIRVIAGFGMTSGGLPMLALLVGLALQGWLLAWLSFRRAADAQLPGSVAAWTLAPLLQFAFVLRLSLAGGGKASEAEASDTAPLAWPAAAQGLILGGALTIAGVAVGALAFGAYGWGVFVFTPLIVGWVTGWLANRRGDIGGAATFGLVATSVSIGGVGLIVTALEGVICIVMAAPLAFPFAALGGHLGRRLAVRRYERRAETFASFALLPLLFAIEHALPPRAEFVAHQSIEIAAGPEAVWQALVAMEPISAPPGPLYRLGVGYPVSARLEGEGVGARRIGVFSTGEAQERVTAWGAGRVFAYEVLRQPPAMKELSPYDTVHAPHAVGYFRTSETRFEIQPLAGGGVRLVETSRHELRLDPAFYWLPMARLMVAQNNARVLAHIKSQAER